MRILPDTQDPARLDHSPPDGLEPTLCFPDQEKSCFACCPPIRPAKYEHIQHRTIIQRMLRENTKAFDSQDRNLRPITGFSCWALGYLDDDCRLVGCLLHPARHQGKDFRFLTDYGEKCRRENCPESRVFLELSVDARRFWLHLTDGLDSLHYSSRRFNPLFRLLGWGSNILNLIAHREADRVLDRKHFFSDYPFFAINLDPKSHAYLLSELILDHSVHLLQTPSFLEHFEHLSKKISDRLKKAFRASSNAPYTHSLQINSQFSDYLRLALGIKRIEFQEALRLKAYADQALRNF